MKDLLIFELKKIVRKKLNIIVVLASFALTALLFISPVIQFISFDKDGNQERGFTDIELEKSNKLYEEIDKNPGYYRDICDYILNSGSTDFAEEEINAIEKIRDDAVEVVNKKFNGKGRS